MRYSPRSSDSPASSSTSVSAYGSRPRNGRRFANRSFSPLRAVHRQSRLVPAAQRERLQHPRQAEEVVGVEVGQEDVLEVGQADDRALELPLRALGAVEEELLAAAPHEERRRSALCGRHRGRGAEEEKVEVHAGRF